MLTGIRTVVGHWEILQLICFAMLETVGVDNSNVLGLVGDADVIVRFHDHVVRGMDIVSLRKSATVS